MPWSLLTDFQAYDDGKCYGEKYMAHVHLRLREKKIGNILGHRLTHQEGCLETRSNKYLLRD
jgi:hypothetical protein